ncbi:hypothetical protein AXG93_1130s1210 [Marchantia polymorpha subsp. ruderalis]|uniref:Selenoprotein K n=1 Tax=Marchantia polymorpha subsp. ruderalis TaxID=1480154 RepID=A0A176VFZ3_MARPO|nr:hypothetical protein AXG93_1130s1210 [Marchantia polymorpha subsp. ruderalis]
MEYISAGEVTGKRSPWRLSFISETFWAIINLVMGFIMTMFSMEAASSYGKKQPTKRSPSGFGNGGGPPGFGGGGPGGPGGRPGGGGSGPRGLSGLSNVRGIDHTTPLPCGSCCG